MTHPTSQGRSPYSTGPLPPCSGARTPERNRRGEGRRVPATTPSLDPFLPRKERAGSFAAPGPAPYTSEELHGGLIPTGFHCVAALVPDPQRHRIVRRRHDVVAKNPVGPDTGSFGRRSAPPKRLGSSSTRDHSLAKMSLLEGAAPRFRSDPASRCFAPSRARRLDPRLPSHGAYPKIDSASKGRNHLGTRSYRGLSFRFDFLPATVNGK